MCKRIRVQKRMRKAQSTHYGKNTENGEMEMERERQRERERTTQNSNSKNDSLYIFRAQ